MATETEDYECTKPTTAECRDQIRLLREFIDDKDNDPLEIRIAQVKEDTLRWAFEATTWAAPVDDMGMAAIIRNDPRCA